MNNYNDYTKITSYIGMNSGRNFDLVNPEKSTLTIQDVAHALSNTCRFNGHCDRFYSVAEHSVMVSYLIEQEFAFDGLMHDISEAVLGDVSTPLKKLLPDYHVIEDRVEASLFKRYGIAYPLIPQVKKADLTALAIEKRDLMPRSGEWPVLNGIIIPEGFTAIGMPPEVAKKRFLERHRELVDLFVKKYTDSQKDVDSGITAG
ncbi:hypothetical protein D3C87_279460 [compost metagenome]